MLRTLEVFQIEALREPTIFVGSDIIAQVSPDVRAQSLLPRPSDVRLLMVTADEGRHFPFNNHGHPDNEESTVNFDGKNAVMMMPAGDNAAQQLDNARRVIDTLSAEGLERITSSFIAKHIADPNGTLRSAVAQIYGPISGAEGVQQQTARFQSSDILDNSGNVVTSDPVITNNYAVGMRAPVNEEVYLLMYNSIIPAYIIGDEYSDRVVQATKALLRGDETTSEKLDGAFVWSSGIVLSVDAGGGKVKPIRMDTAEKIFDLSKATVLLLNRDGVIVNQYRPHGPGHDVAAAPAHDKI